MKTHYEIIEDLKMEVRLLSGANDKLKEEKMKLVEETKHWYHQYCDLRNKHSHLEESYRLEKRSMEYMIGMMEEGYWRKYGREYKRLYEENEDLLNKICKKRKRLTQKLIKYRNIIRKLDKENNLAHDDINYLLMEKNRYLRALQELTRTDYGKVKI